MKKEITLLIVFLGLFCSSQAQDLTAIFLKIPDNIIPGLTAEDKDKLIAPSKDSGNVFVEAAFGDTLQRLDVSVDYISIKTSNAGSLQIKLLPLINGSKIICVVKTVCGKACDSYINFYTTDWIIVSSEDLFVGKNKSWFLKSDVDASSDEYKNATTVLDMHPIKLTLTGSDLSLTAEYDIEKYLSPDDYKKTRPFLIENPKVFNWDKVRFK